MVFCFAFYTLYESCYIWWRQSGKKTVEGKRSSVSSVYLTSWNVVGVCAAGLRVSGSFLIWLVGWLVRDLMMTLRLLFIQINIQLAYSSFLFYFYSCERFMLSEKSSLMLDVYMVLVHA